MSQLSYSVDPRLPVSPNQSTSDSSHPTNVIKKLLETGNQATADAHYDNKAQRLPRGVTEGFVNPFAEYLYVILAVSVIIASVILVTRVVSLIIKILCVVAILYAIHYLIGRLEKRTL
jgi:Flp pilus assembly protein TadB